MTLIHNPKQIAHTVSTAVSVPEGTAENFSAIHALFPRNEMPEPQSALSLQELVAGRAYSDLDVCITEEDRAFWCFMKPQQRPSFTPQLLSDLTDVQRLIRKLLKMGRRRSTMLFWARTRRACSTSAATSPFCRKNPSARSRRAARYARACVEVGICQSQRLRQRGGYHRAAAGRRARRRIESALSCDMLIAERQTKFGLPEVLFNLFPGMGAYSFLSRRVGMVKAEEIILGGRTYTAEEMLALGAIDMVVEPGEGERAVREQIARNRSRQLALSAVYKVRRRVNPVSLEELNDITELWVDTALRLSDQDLRRMCRIAAAQDRFRARALQG